MSRSHKTDRARRAHVPHKLWRVSYGQVVKATTPEDPNSRPDYQAARAAAQQTLEDAGMVLPHHGPDPLAEDRRTGGVRYGNQRKMRARGDLAARRADRKRDPAPILDAEGDLGLENKPSSPARRRGPRWTK